MDGNSNGGESRRHRQARAVVDVLLRRPPYGNMLSSSDGGGVLFAKAAHSKEVKSLKADAAKLSAKLVEALEGFTIVSEALKSAREDALREFKASKDFHKEAMAHAEMHARTIVDKWLEGEFGKRYLLNLGEADYGMGYQDRGEDATLNASADTVGGEILIDDAYLNSPANLNSMARMGQASIPTLVEDGQGDAAATEEEDPSAALQLNRQRSGSSERNLPIGPSEVDAEESRNPRSKGRNRSPTYLVAL
nr:uncharacterized protein LOC109180246 [Ipomoea trifida]